MYKHVNYSYGEQLFIEFCRLFPEHDFSLIDVFVASLNDDRIKTSYRIKSRQLLMNTCWPRMTDKEWKISYSGICADYEMVSYVYEQVMVELGKWKVNDPDTGDYFAIDPDKYFMFIDVTTNYPVEYAGLPKSFKFPEVL